MSNVSGTIKSIQDIMRKDVGVDGDAQRISQLVWMFFLKIFDDREAELELLAEDGDEYKSPLPGHLRWRSWAKDAEGKTGEELSMFVNDQLFPYLKDKLPVMGPTAKRAQVIREVFADTYNYMKSGTLMRQVINKICEIDFNNSEDRHTFGNIYEQILKDLQSAGNAGEFYTPRAVTQFIVDRIDPQLDESVLDPACGTGGFLTCTIEHKRSKYVNSTAEQKILASSIHGIEKKSLPHMLCITNMILHGIDTPTNVRHNNTLSRSFKDYSDRDRVNVIITNPPFGGMEEDGIENNFPSHLRTRETADLFMALIIRLLKHEGRAAVVLPDGFLFGEGMKTRLKKDLLETCNLHTIIRLPNGVFNPYTGIKTNILFFSKGTPTEHVWYYEHPYPEGVTSYNKTKPMRFEEFQNEIEWWGTEKDGFSARVENRYAWKVDAEDIVKRNYNLDFKNPYVNKKIVGDPNALLHELKNKNQEINKTNEKLKIILSDALVERSKAQDKHNLTDIIVGSLNIWTSTNLSEGSTRGNSLQTVYGIKKLRELVLGLALQGAFSEHKESLPVTIDSDIKKAKASYFKSNDRRPKEYKFGPPLLNEFTIPSNWQWKRVGELCDLQTGATPSTQKTEYYGGNNPWLVSGDINQGIIEDCEGRITDEGLESSNCKILPLNTVLIALNGQGKTRATVALLKVPAACNQSLVGMVPFDPLILDPVYLLYALRYRYLEIRDITGQNQRRGLNMGLVAELSIPLAPLREQKAIVTKVDEMMSLCDHLDFQLIESINIQKNFADTIVELAVT